MNAFLSNDTHARRTYIRLLLSVCSVLCSTHLICMHVQFQLDIPNRLHSFIRPQIFHTCIFIMTNTPFISQVSAFFIIVLFFFFHSFCNLMFVILIETKRLEIILLWMSDCVWENYRICAFGSHCSFSLSRQCVHMHKGRNCSQSFSERNESTLRKYSKNCWTLKMHCTNFRQWKIILRCHTRYMAF